MAQEVRLQLLRGSRKPAPASRAAPDDSRGELVDEVAGTHVYSVAASSDGTHVVVTCVVDSEHVFLLVK